MGIFDIFKKKETDELGNVIDEKKEESFNSNILDSSAFSFTVEDAFTITGRCTVVTGIVESGSISLGDEVIITHSDESYIKSAVTGIEMFRKLLNTANKGDRCGLLLRGLKQEDVSPHDIITKVE